MQASLLKKRNVPLISRSNMRSRKNELFYSYKLLFWKTGNVPLISMSRAEKDELFYSCKLLFWKRGKLQVELPHKLKCWEVNNHITVWEFIEIGPSVLTWYLTQQFQQRVIMLEIRSNWIGDHSLEYLLILAPCSIAGVRGKSIPPAKTYPPD